VTTKCICGQRVEILDDLSGRSNFRRLARHSIHLVSFELVKRGNALGNDVFHVACPLSEAELEVGKMTSL
jgi:hypothetical protein